MDRSLGAIVLIIIVSVLGVGEVALVLGGIFLLLVGLFYVFIVIADEASSSTTKDILEKAPEMMRSPGFVDDREKWMNEWVTAEYKRHPENGAIIWRWIDFDNYDTIEFTLDNEGITYIGDVIYATKEHPECHDQERVLRIDSVIKGTEIKKTWEGTGMKRVPIESIQKNIQNSLKNDRELRKILEEAFDQCLENGEAVFDLDDINLDFTDNRVKREFLKACLKSCSFSSMHIQADGHRVKVFIGDKDPI